MQLLIIAAALLSILVQGSYCQFGSPPLCLLNRLDFLPCNIVNTGRPPVPQINEYAAYTTTIRETPLKCSIRSRDNHILQAIPTIGGDPRILYLFSPGYGQQDYRNEQLIRYRVQCPSNHFSVFNLVSLDLEPPSCNDNGQTKCVDYLLVSQLGGGFGSLEACGNIIPSSLQQQLNSDTIEVILRTSETVRFPGFSANVVCVDTALLSGLDGGTAPGARIGGTGVSARLEQLNTRTRRRVEYVHRMRQSVADEARSLACSVDDVNIPFDAGITYINRVVSIVDMDTMTVIRRLPAPINKLTLLDTSGSTQEFYREAPLTNGSITVFPGPGPLTRAGVFVFYTSFTTIPELGNISPQLVIPSGLEANVTATLLAGHVSQALNQQIACNYTDSEILLAILNQHTLNPVLATVVDVVLECTNRTQPGRIEPIAATIPLDFQFSQEVVSVAEENGTVSVCVEIASNLPRNVEIRVVSQDGSATEPSDYTAVNTTVTFLSGTARDGPGSHMCIDIMISNDSTVELDEAFLLTAHSLDTNVNIINNATVIIINTDEPVFRFTQDVLTACERDGVAIVNSIELVSGTLGFPIDISVHVEGVLNSILTFPSGSVPNTQLSFSINSSSTHQILNVTASPENLFQSNMNSATIAHFTDDREPELYCTPFLRGPTDDNGFVEVELQNGTFRFLEQNHTSVFVNSNGHVSLNTFFLGTSISSFPVQFPLAPPLLAPFWADADPSAGGLVLYRETQDDLLLSRAAEEVSTAFPGQPTFIPVSLFIATWLQVSSANSFPPGGGGPAKREVGLPPTRENTYQIIMATDDQASYVTFLYNDIQWTDLGHALAGINGGDGNRALTIRNSLSDAITNLVTTSNVRMPGVWMYKVDSSAIIDPGAGF